MEPLPSSRILCKVSSNEFTACETQTNHIPLVLCLELIVFRALTVGCTDDRPENVEINIDILNGSLVSSGSTVADRGDTVTFKIRSNEDGLLHLHGYDVQLVLRQGVLTRFLLEANATGRFLITLHELSSSDGHDHESEGRNEESMVSGEIILGYFQVNPK